MRATLFLPSLIASVSAIDAYLQVERCGSGGIVCTNLTPDKCCSRPWSTYKSIWYRAIPGGWNVAVRGHTGGDCGPVNFQWTHQGPADFCTGPYEAGKFSGTGYGLPGKRSVAATGDCQKPDKVMLGDGTMYDITDMAEDHIDELIAIVQAGGNSTAVPAQFAKYMKN